jgi:hypothetical protein
MDCSGTRIPMKTTAMNTADNNKGQTGKYRMATPKVDMTPMVDLGFLLITFFIFTTSLSKPAAMKLYMPDDKGDPTPVKCSVSFTLLPAGRDKVGWYECRNGVSRPLKYTTLVEQGGLRELLIRKRNEVTEKFGSARELTVMIKPLANCDYAILVDILDEMTINGITRYAIVDERF